MVLVEDERGVLHQLVEVDEDGWRAGEFSGRASSLIVGHLRAGQPLSEAVWQSRCDAGLVPSGPLSMEAEAPGLHLVSVFGLGVAKLFSRPARRDDWAGGLVHVGLTTLAPLDAQLEGCDLRGLRSVAISGPGLCEADVVGLSQLTRLTHLDLSLARDGLPLDAVARLSGLTHLTLPRRSRGRVDGAPLAALTGLVHLDAASTDLLDPGVISRLEALERLSLPALPEGDVSLGPLTRLRVLRVGSCPGMRSLAGLAGLSSLTALELEGLGDLEGLSPLAALTSLRSLTLAGCARVIDLAPLAQLTSLDDLTLGGAFADLGPIGRLPQLRSLALVGCDHLEDLSPLAPRDPPRGFGPWVGRLFGRLAPGSGGLTGLRSLALRGCRKLRELSPLGKLDHLVDLELADLGEVTTVAWLGAMRGLHRLSLRGAGFGRLTDLAPPEALPALRHLTLEGLGPRAALPNLTQAPELSALVYRGQVIEGRAFDLRPLGDAPRLRSLQLALSGPVDLEHVGSLRALSTLVLQWPDALEPPSLRPVARAERLGMLTLVGRGGLWDLGALNRCSRLQVLAVWGRAATLPVLPRLRDLMVEQADRLSDLGPLREAPLLESLWLCHARGCSDLSPLAGASELRNLDLSGAERLVDLGPLASLRGLCSLGLAGASRLQDLRPVGSLRALVSFDLARCRAVDDLTPLRSLGNLRSLTLDETRWENIDLETLLADSEVAKALVSPELTRVRGRLLGALSRRVALA